MSASLVLASASPRRTALLNQLPALSGHWLDIGCGTGVALPHLRLKGASRVTGIDLAEGMLEAAARVTPWISSITWA